MLRDSTFLGLTLNEILNTCVKKLGNSFFKEAEGIDFSISDNDWHSSVKIFSSITDSNVFKDQFGLENCRVLSEHNNNSNLKFILVSEYTILCVFAKEDLSDKARDKARKKFDLISALQKFVIYKLSIYTDLKNMVADEIQYLKEMRLLKWTIKYKVKDLLRLNAYDPSLFSIASDLNRYTEDNYDLDNLLRDFHSSYCKLSGCDEKFTKLNSHKLEYESEVEKYQTLLQLLSVFPFSLVAKFFNFK